MIRSHLVIILRNSSVVLETPRQIMNGKLTSNLKEHYVVLEKEIHTQNFL